MPGWLEPTNYMEEEDNDSKRMRSSLCWFPVLLVVCTVIAFSISYALAVVRDDVDPFWPYISDTGTKKPESCIFGQLLNFAAFFAMATMIIRYKLVQAFNNHDRSLRILNITSLVIGGLSALGVSLVANFQESNVISVHVTGALLAFGLGVVYCFFHSAITRKMYPTYNGYCIWVARLVISLVGAVALITTVVMAGIATNQATPDFKKSAGYPLHWNSSEPGYDAHVGSAVSEWMIGISFLAFFLSYVKDFQKISMRILPTLLVSHLDESPRFNNYDAATERTGLLA